MQRIQPTIHDCETLLNDKRQTFVAIDIPYSKPILIHTSHVTCIFIATFAKACKNIRIYFCYVLLFLNHLRALELKSRYAEIRNSFESSIYDSKATATAAVAINLYVVQTCSDTKLVILCEVAIKLGITTFKNILSVYVCLLLHFFLS